MQWLVTMLVVAFLVAVVAPAWAVVAAWLAEMGSALWSVMLQGSYPLVTLVH